VLELDLTPRVPWGVPAGAAFFFCAFAVALGLGFGLLLFAVFVLAVVDLLVVFWACDVLGLGA
jgi:hypothetical protein